MNNKSKPSHARNLAATVSLLAAFCCGAPAHAADGDPQPWLRPTAIFGQVGSGEQVQSTSLGAFWAWDWRAPLSAGLLTGYTEASLGEWRGTSGRDDQYVTQVGIKPALRLYPGGAEAGWFVEGGIGANSISPRYQKGDRSFSTVFNFSEHVGVGQRFGAHGEHEVALRVEHFSNAGLQTPNPGEQFVQLRYVRHF